MIFNSNLYVIKNNITLTALILFIAILPLSLLIGSLLINLNVILISIFFLIIVFKNKKYNIFSDSFLILILFFWFSLLVNLIFSSNLENSLTRALGFSRFILLAYAIKYCLNLQSKKFHNFIFKLWSLIFFAVTLDLIFEYFVGFNTLGFKSYMPGRLSGFLNQELKIGHFYSAFFLIFALLIYKFFQKKNIFYLTLIACLIVSLMIGERANFLRVFAIIILFFLIVENISWIKKLLLLSASFIIIIFFVSTNEHLKTRFYEQFIKPAIVEFDVEYLVNNNMYFANYDRAYRIYKKNKYFGVGLKNFRIESQKEKYKNENLKFNHQAHTTHPHQIHLEFLSETGLFGYLSFIIFIFGSLFFFIKSYMKNKNHFSMASMLYVFLSVAPLLPSGSFFTTYGATLFWINYGIMISNTEKSK